MKKFLSIFLVAVMTIVMVPSFFASAAELPAQPVVVAADDGGQTGQVDNTLKSLTEVLGGLWEFFQGLFKGLLGEDFLKEIGPALKKVLTIVSPGEFFKIVKGIFEDMFKR